MCWFYKYFQSITEGWVYYITTCVDIFSSYLLFKIVPRALLFFAEMKALFLSVE